MRRNCTYQGDRHLHEWVELHAERQQGISWDGREQRAYTFHHSRPLLHHGGRQRLTWIAWLAGDECIKDATRLQAFASLRCSGGLLEKGREVRVLRLRMVVWMKGRGYAGTPRETE